MMERRSKNEHADAFSFTSMPDGIMQLTVDAICNKVTAASWRMVYTISEEEFEKLWCAMIADCEDLGAQDVIDWRLEDLATRALYSLPELSCKLKERLPTSFANT